MTTLVLGFKFITQLKLTCVGFCSSVDSNKWTAHKIMHIHVYIYSSTVHHVATCTLYVHVCMYNVTLHTRKGSSICLFMSENWLDSSPTRIDTWRDTHNTILWNTAVCACQTVQTHPRVTNTCITYEVLLVFWRNVLDPWPLLQSRHYQFQQWCKRTGEHPDHLLYSMLPYTLSDMPSHLILWMYAVYIKG